jgi:RimJ/RimL family protein N-acetyltransferase
MTQTLPDRLLDCHIRPITSHDAARLVDLHHRCSPGTRYFRYHSPKPRLRTAEAVYLAGVDGARRVALVATAIEDGEERVIGDARFDLIGAGDAEAALLLRDDVQGAGLGSLLFRRLLHVAREQGVRRIVLDILPQNRPMLALAARFGAHPLSFDGQSVRYVLEVTP